MGFRDVMKRAAKGLWDRASETLPRVASEMSQQTLEAMPLWDKGWASRAQSTRMANAIDGATERGSGFASREKDDAPQTGKIEEKLTSIDMHLAALVKTQTEAAERQKAAAAAARQKKAQTEIKRRGPHR